MVSRRGYTLIELMVTIAVLAIVSTMALATGRAVTRGNDDVTAAFAVTKVAASQRETAATLGAYASHPDDLRLPREITAVTGASTRPGEVSIAVGRSGTLALASVSATGACKATRTSPLSQGGETTSVDLPATAVCSAIAALTPGDPALEPERIQP